MVAEAKDGLPGDRYCITVRKVECDLGAPVTAITSLDHPAVDAIMRAWNEHQDLHVEPGNREALVIPKAMMAELGLPDVALEPIAAAWDGALLLAIAETVDVGRELAARLRA
jgi:hypothetical protein